MATTSKLSLDEWRTCGDFYKMRGRIPLRTAHAWHKMYHLIAALLRLGDQRKADTERFSAAFDAKPLFEYQRLSELDLHLHGIIREFEKNSPPPHSIAVEDPYAMLFILQYRIEQTRNERGTRFVGFSAVPEAAQLLRDVYPFPKARKTPPAVHFGGWLSDTVVRMASHAWSNRDYSVMPILADALQDAGCDDDDVLSHLRAPTAHCRGCWVLNGVLDAGRPECRLPEGLPFRETLVNWRFRHKAPVPWDDAGRSRPLGNLESAAVKYLRTGVPVRRVTAWMNGLTFDLMARNQNIDDLWGRRFVSGVAPSLPWVQTSLQWVNRVLANDDIPQVAIDDAMPDDRVVIAAPRKRGCLLFWD